jgi:hypothetical protein
MVSQLQIRELTHVRTISQMIFATLPVDVKVLCAGLPAMRIAVHT